MLLLVTGGVFCSGLTSKADTEDILWDIMAGNPTKTVARGIHSLDVGPKVSLSGAVVCGDILRSYLWII